MIDYPTKPSEFEIQAELYFFLKSKLFDVRGEVRIKKRLNVKGARLDLVIYKNKNAIAVIEVKDSLRKSPNQKHSKINHYWNLTKVPQATFYRNDDAEDLARRIQKLNGDSTPFKPAD